MILLFPFESPLISLSTNMIHHFRLCVYIVCVYCDAQDAEPVICDAQDLEHTTHDMPRSDDVE